MTIRVSSSVRDLTGIGIEYLADAEGNIIAQFFDGNMPRESGSVDAEAATIAN